MYFKLFNVKGEMVDNINCRSVNQAIKYFAFKHEGIFRMAWDDNNKILDFYVYGEKLV